MGSACLYADMLSNEVPRFGQKLHRKAWIFRNVVKKRRGEAGKDERKRGKEMEFAHRGGEEERRRGRVERRRKGLVRIRGEDIL